MRGVKILELRFGALWAMLLMLLGSSETHAQKGNTVNLLEFKYGFHVPAGDLNSRFGSNSDIGLSIQSVSLAKKYFFGIEGIYMFGNDVKEDVLAQLRTFDGSIIGIDGGAGDINLKERGFYVGVNAVKIIPTTANSKKLTGIRIQVGGGLLQHKIRVQDNSENIVPLEKKYLQGYDRLTNGPAVHLGLGYQYQSPTNNFQFHVMGDLYGASTSSRRDLDYATGGYLDQKRTDILGGLSVAYIVVISRVNKPENIYY
jgi:hypothetical protein